MADARKITADFLHQHDLDLARATTRLCYQQQPALETRYGEKGREKCVQDSRYHISYLSEAILAASPALFRNYVEWAQQMLESRNIPTEDLAQNLNSLKEILAQRLPIENYVIAAKYLNGAVTQLTGEVEKEVTFLPEGAPLMELATQYLNLLLNGQRGVASKAILKEAESGTPVREIYLHVFQPVQYEIGRLWQLNEISVAQEHYCTAATQLIMSQLYPYIFNEEPGDRTLVATCIAGDLHEVGVRMVTDFFEMEGWETYFLGANAPLNSIISTLKQQKAQLLLVSATMTYHVRAVAELIKMVRKDQELQGVKVLVGGYPFNTAPELWKEVDADAFAANAEDALIVADELVPLNTK